MNITSINAVGLYKTLAYPTLVKSEFSTPEDAAREAKNFDRFESSGVDSIENLMGLHSPTSFMFIKSGLGMSDSEIAEHVGGIGKRLDEAYASGKFTKEEYDELNQSLDDYAVKLANKSKRMEASWSLTRNLTPAEFSMITQKAEAMTAEEYLADRKAEIDTYIKQNPVDMKLIFKLISTFRYGNGEFEPKVIEKRQTRTDEIEQKIMAMYAKGMSQRDIEDTFREIYGSDISQGMISKITDRILPEVNEWQNRPLNKIYPVIFFDGIVFNSRKDNKIVSKCVYSVLGINMEGQKEIWGMWISENESANFYASICADLKNRGVTDIFIACHDNLTGLNEAIKSIFPKTKNQLYIVHQIRNSCKFVPYKDRKSVCADLKKIYSAVNLDDAEFAKEEFREKLDKKYPNILKSWDKNWAELTAFFEFPHEIRRIIYTTNTVEAYHRMVRKFTKSKAIFPTDDSIRKVVYMSVPEISKKWTMSVRDWGLAYAQFMIFFEDRLAA